MVPLPVNVRSLSTVMSFSLQVPVMSSVEPASAASTASCIGVVPMVWVVQSMETVGGGGGVGVPSVGVPSVGVPELGCGRGAGTAAGDGAFVAGVVGVGGVGVAGGGVVGVGGVRRTRTR